MKDFGDVIWLAFVATGFALAGFSLGQKWAHDDAIEAGVAHWSCDPQTGEKTFVWEAPKQ